MLMKEMQIKREKEKTEKNQLNLFSKKKNKKYFFNNKEYINNHKSFTYKYIPRNISILKNEKKKIDSEASRNIQVQTTLSSLNNKKKFKTPYQILHLKNKMLKDLLEYSKNYPKIPNLNKKLINIRPYSNGNTKKYESFSSSPKSEILKFETTKNYEKGELIKQK